MSSSPCCRFCGDPAQATPGAGVTCADCYGELYLHRLPPYSRITSRGEGGRRRGRDTADADRPGGWDDAVRAMEDSTCQE